MNSDAQNITKWTDRPDWMSRIDIDEYERLAAIGYDPRKIAMFYHIPEKDFMWHFNLIGSLLKYHYDRGILVQQAKEGLTMTAAAERGENVTQAQRLDKLRSHVEYQSAINSIFFDDIG